jgi:putative molybdopterin biosynthesis protein
MRIVPQLVWKLEGSTPEVLDGRLLPLLEAIQATASLAAAVAACGISYRAAWGLLRECRGRLGVALVELERGRGATLTPPGERLLAAHQAASRRLARLAPGLAVEIGPRAPAAPAVSMLRLRVAASHDLALAALAEALPADGGLKLELAIMGSLQALEEYAAGRADVAGFHVPIGTSPAIRGAPEWKPFLRWLRPRRDRLLRFVDRDQGLILPRGNPAQVRSFRDIAARRLRFVNRQRGSGTRLLIDRMLAAGGIDAATLAGYRREEFTHGAVAATVASGGADAGFGLRAAAAEYRLAFVPLVRERYYLAVRARDVDAPAIGRLCTALAGPAFAGIVRSLPGYAAEAAGAAVVLDAAGAGRTRSLA